MLNANCKNQEQPAHLVNNMATRHYVSCIKIDGVPLLPPVMTGERRTEMNYYKQRAIKVENRIKQLEREIAKQNVSKAINVDAEFSGTLQADEIDQIKDDDILHLLPDNSNNQTCVPLEKLSNYLPSDVPAINLSCVECNSPETDEIPTLNLSHLNNYVMLRSKGFSNKNIESEKKQFDSEIVKVNELILDLTNEDNTDFREIDNKHEKFDIDNHGTNTDEKQNQKNNEDGNKKSKLCEEEERPCKLIRQNSYTLDSPSPMLLAQLQQSASTKPDFEDSENASTDQKRRSCWDLTNAKKKWSSIENDIGNVYASATKQKNAVKRTPIKHGSSFCCSLEKTSDNVTDDILKMKRQNKLTPSKNRNSSRSVQRNNRSNKEIINETPYKDIQKSVEMRKVNLEIIGSRMLPKKPETEEMNAHRDLEFPTNSLNLSAVQDLHLDISELSNKNLSTDSDIQILQNVNISPVNNLKSNSSKKQEKTTNYSKSKNLKSLEITNESHLMHNSDIMTNKSQEQMKQIQVKPQENIKKMLAIQTEHSKQMTELIGKQKKEQEDLIRMFNERQEALITQMCDSFPDLLAVPDFNNQSDTNTEKCMETDIPERDPNKNDTKLDGLNKNQQHSQFISDPCLLSNRTDNETVSGRTSSQTLYYTSNDSSSTLCELTETPESYVRARSNNQPHRQQEPNQNLNIHGNTKIVTQENFQQYKNNNDTKNCLNENNNQIVLYRRQISPTNCSKHIVSKENHFGDSECQNGLFVVHLSNINTNQEYNLISPSLSELTLNNRDHAHSMTLDNTAFQRKECPASRELFPQNKCRFRHYNAEMVCAVIVIQSAIRGYLVRRLLKTELVQRCYQVVKDTYVCAQAIHEEDKNSIKLADLELHERMLHQIATAIHNIHEIFFETSLTEKLNIIALDRQRVKERLRRPPSIRISPMLTTTTQRFLEKKRQRNLSSSSVTPVSTRCCSARSLTESRSRTKSVGSRSDSGNSSVQKNVHRSSSQNRKPWR